MTSTPRPWTLEIWRALLEADYPVPLAQLVARVKPVMPPGEASRISQKLLEDNRRGMYESPTRQKDPLDRAAHYMVLRVIRAMRTSNQVEVTYEEKPEGDRSMAPIKNVTLTEKGRKRIPVVLDYWAEKNGQHRNGD